MKNPKTPTSPEEKAEFAKMLELKLSAKKTNAERQQASDKTAKKK